MEYRGGLISGFRLDEAQSKWIHNLSSLHFNILSTNSPIQIPGTLKACCFTIRFYFRKAKLKQPVKPSIKRSKNRVWVPPDNETEIVFITPDPPSLQKPAPSQVHQVVDQDKPVPEPVGRDTTVPETVTEQAPASTHQPTKLVEPVQLVGHEKKTKQGNKQWVAGSVTPSRKGVRKRRVSKSKGKSSLVSISGGSYTMDSSKRRLKRLSTSSLHSKHTGSILGGRYAVDASGKRLKRLSSSPFHSKHTGFLLGVDASGRRLKRLSTSGVKPRHKPSLISMDGGRYTMDSSGKKLKRLSTSKHLVSISGTRYTMDSSRKRLKRLSTSSQLTSWSPAISSYIGGVANSTSSVKRMLAR